MRRSSPVVVALFVVAVFASAFLIFLVQPMVGKRILPWFGGVPAVWALCLAFFQTTLFAGYAYAHLLIRHVAPGAQLALHGLACLGALALLPVLPGDAWKPTGHGDPSAAILAMLGAHVALPFGVLAATGPLVQAWFARLHADRSPYPLYAVSNLGSLAALLGYPFLIEPAWTLSATGRAWSLGFALCAAAVVGCAALAWRGRPGPDAAPTPPLSPPASRLHRALWVALPGTAVVLLMGVTNELCIDTASVPFLWILPLATYLSTFILCFSSWRVYWRIPYLLLSVAALVFPTLLQRAAGNVAPLELTLGIVRYCLLLFGACMLLHGELYRLRPAADRLTSFYLRISFGGAAGGILAGVVAPLVFDDFYELPLGLAVGWALFLAACHADPSSWLAPSVSRWRWLTVAAATVWIVQTVLPQAQDGPDVVHQERSFFGVLRVREASTEDGRLFTLLNGTTLHGAQFTARPRMPTSYYGRLTGVGLLFADPDRPPELDVGTIGLGVGTLAIYGRLGDRFRFYEIDPAVIRLARDDAYFSFLARSRAEIEVVEGDARISLERERAAGGPRFDVLIVDAYSSDALPMHLLTREALALYLASLKDDGLLGFHVSSRSFDLLPLLGRLAHDAGVSLLEIQTPRVKGFAGLHARWIFLSPSAERLATLERSARAQIKTLEAADVAFEITSPPPAAFADAPLWTDDYSDLLGVLKRP